MPIKNDGAGKRWVEVEVLLPGTPEQVWHAVATGPGNAAWFTKGDIEPKVGGAMRFDFGHGAVSTGEVTAWEPPHRFAYVERDWKEGAPPVATEIAIAGRSGERSVMRMVHSLFTTEVAWDPQIEGFESGWPGFFEVLRVYLTHFAGEPAASFMTVVHASGDSLAVWRSLSETLGLAGANVGERRSFTSAPEPWSGVVELVRQDAQQRYVLLRLDAPSPGTALLGVYATDHGITVTLTRFFYGEDAPDLAAASEPRWREFLTEAFGA